MAEVGKSPLEKLQPGNQKQDNDAGKAFQPRPDDSRPVKAAFPLENSPAGA